MKTNETSVAGLNAPMLINTDTKVFPIFTKISNGYQRTNSR